MKDSQAFQTRGFILMRLGHYFLVSLTPPNVAQQPESFPHAGPSWVVAAAIRVPPPQPGYPSVA